MEFVDVSALVAIQALVRRRYDQQSVGCEYAGKFREHLRLVDGIQMLDGLERHNDVDRRIRQRQRGTGTAKKADTALFAVPFAGVRNGGCVDIDPDDAARNGSEERAAISLTAGRIEHPLARCKLARKRVTMPMLVRDFAGAAGNEALPGERDIESHAGIVPRTPIAQAPRAKRNFTRSTRAGRRDVRRRSIRAVAPAVSHADEAQLARIAFDDKRFFDIIEQPGASWIEHVRSYQVFAGQERELRKC